MSKKNKRDQELRRKLKELQLHAAKENVNISEDILRLEQKLGKAEKTIPDVWTRVNLARHPERPTTLDYAERIFDHFIEIHGDRGFADDHAMVCGLAMLNDIPVTFIGQQRGRNLKENLVRNFGQAHPEGYRKALRLVKEAEKFGRPVISFIDTQGAFCGTSAEERGIGEAIARNLKEFSTLKTPVICFVIGEGGSGGALGIGVGDRVYMLENSIYSVITPEGCASIILRDAGKARQAANMLKLTSFDIQELGVIDGIIPEPNGGAQNDKDYVARHVKEQILEVLPGLMKMSTKRLLEKRYKKYRKIGIFTEDVRSITKMTKFVLR
ncbi:MAG: acetyl-CoA carboxylase carboxyltransferase subunit alpha [Spirochaetales bacterium]|nr:acetyl-CoA carboxylase carboxyltransferase subunit alpha [Spirochaetales bacterium]